jgi:hydroxypyruvate isomerase
MRQRRSRFSTDQIAERVMPKFCANLTMLYGEHQFLDRFGAAARDGFAAVEYMFPYQFPKEQLVGALKAHRLTQVLHNLPAGDWDGGDRGIAVQPDRKDEFREGVARAVEYATALACHNVNCLVGIPRADDSSDVVRHTVVENLRYAAAVLKKVDVKLLIEPVNDKDIPGFWLTRADQAVSVIEEVGSDNLFLQYDIYHQARMDGELTATFRRLRDRIAHVQVADNPGRNEPGTGEINYRFMFDMLDREGYAGWIGCEYRPAAGTSAGLGWAAAYLGRK